MIARIEGKGWRMSSGVHRPNKVAVHYQRKSKHNTNDHLRLAVYGTLDTLAGRRGVLAIAKRVEIEHPIDKGYFKKAYVLSNYGKILYKQKHNGNQQSGTGT